MMCMARAAAEEELKEREQLQEELRRQSTAWQTKYEDRTCEWQELKEKHQLLEQQFNAWQAKCARYCRSERQEGLNEIEDLKKQLRQYKEGLTEREQLQEELAQLQRQTIAWQKKYYVRTREWEELKDKHQECEECYSESLDEIKDLRKQLRQYEEGQRKHEDDLKEQFQKFQVQERVERERLLEEFREQWQNKYDALTCEWQASQHKVQKLEKQHKQLEKSEEKTALHAAIQTVLADRHL
eukprot:2817267-Amphidinium_carterae.1